MTVASLNFGEQSSTARNSSVTPLGSSETFTGVGEQNPHPDAMAVCYTDQPGTLYFDFSPDGANWDSTFPPAGFAVSAGVNEFHTAVKGPRWFRVRLVNGSGAQSYLRLFTYYGVFRHGNAPLNQSASIYQDAQFVRGTLPEDEIRIGRRSGVEGWTKWGLNADVDTAAAEVIASFGGTFTPMDTAETFTIAYNSTTDGSGTTGATQLSFSYIDADGLPATATHTLGDDGSDVTSFTGLGINRLAVSASGTADTNTNAITVTATTATTNQAQIPAEAGVTQQAIFFTGANHDAVAKFLLLNINKVGGGSPVCTIKGVVYNRAVQTNYEIFRYTMDTGVENNVIIHEPVGFNLSPTDVLYFTADTTTNDTEVNLRFSLVEYQRS